MGREERANFTLLSNSGLLDRFGRQIQPHDFVCVGGPVMPIYQVVSITPVLDRPSGPPTLRVVLMARIEDQFLAGKACPFLASVARPLKPEDQPAEDLRIPPEEPPDAPTEG